MIVEATGEHAPAIRAIAEKSWQAAYRDILSVAQYDYMIDLFYALPALRQTMQEQTFLLFMKDDVPVGFVSYQLHCPARGSCKIHKLYMLPEAQGGGAGRKLLEAVTGIAGRKNCQVLTLNVNKYNKALDFYQKVGFSIERAEVIDIGGGYVMDDFVLIKNLTPPSERVG